MDSSQQEKGFYFLKKQYKTPTGKLNKNNPFGAREIYVLENAKEIRLYELYNSGTFYTFYLPIYEVISKSGDSFLYYYNGKIEIIG